MSTTTETETRTISEQDLDRLLRDVDDEGRLVLTARRLGNGRVALTIGRGPAARRESPRKRRYGSGLSTSDHCFSESQKS